MPAFNLGLGLSKALGGLGGDALNRFNKILGSNLNESYLRNYFGGDTSKKFGMNQLQGLIGSGDITANPRLGFLNSVLNARRAGNTPVQPPPPPPPSGPEFVWGTGLGNRLGSLGGNFEQKLNNILAANTNESFLSGLIGKAGGGPVQFGFPQLLHLLESGNITAENRQAIIRQILGNREGGVDYVPPDGGQGNGDGGGGGGGGGDGDDGFEPGDPLEFPDFENEELSAWLSNLLQNGILGDNQGIFDQLIQKLQNPLNSGQMRQFDQAIEALLAGPQGEILSQSPEDLLRNASNSVSARLQGRERDLIRQAGDRFAGRNLGGSGVAERGLRGIEDNTSELLARQLSDLNLQGTLGFGNLELQQAGLAQQGQQGALSGLLGLGSLGQSGQNAALNNLLQLAQGNMMPGQLSAARELGLGELEMDKARLQLQKIMQEFQNNLLLKSNFFGADGEGEGPPPWLRDLLKNFGGNFNPARNPI